MPELINITSLPAFILLALATGCKRHARSFQVMLSAKLSKVMHGILLTIRGDHQGRFSVRWCVSNRFHAYLLDSFRTMLLASASIAFIALRFLTILSTWKMSEPMSL